MSKAEKLLEDLVHKMEVGRKTENIYQELLTEIQRLESECKEWAKVTGYTSPALYSFLRTESISRALMMSKAEVLLNKLVDALLDEDDGDNVYQDLMIEIKRLERYNERWIQVTGCIHPDEYERDEVVGKYKDPVVLALEPEEIDWGTFNRGIEAAEAAGFTPVPGGRRHPIIESDGEFGRKLKERILSLFGKD